MLEITVRLKGSGIDELVHQAEEALVQLSQIGTLRGTPGREEA